MTSLIEKYTRGSTRLIGHVEADMESLLRRKKCLLLDGGLATELERRGHPIQGDPLWGARYIHTHPEVIVDVHKDFLEAGCDIITTASYQASVGGFMKYLHMAEEDALALIGRSVALAKQARRCYLEKSERSDPVLIAGSVGPYGACQHDLSEYHGNYVDVLTEEELIEWHRPRVEKLLEGGVDILAIETIPALKEAVALSRLLVEFSSAKAWVSFSCKDSSHTSHGEAFKAAVEALATCNQVTAVGVNCTMPQHIQLVHYARLYGPLWTHSCFPFESLNGKILKMQHGTHHVALQGFLESVEGVTDKPLVVYPNSGETWSNENNRWNGTKTNLNVHLPMWLEKGVRIAGGCCRVTPEAIFQLHETLHSDTTMS